MYRGVGGRRRYRATPLKRPAIGALPLCAGLLLALPSSAVSQAEPLAPGLEARLYVRGLIAPLEGTLLAVGREVRIETADGVLTISAEQVERSEVMASRGNSRRGAVIGLAVGVVVGVVALIGSRESCRPGPDTVCGVPKERSEAWTLVVPAAAGAGLGALIGSQVRSSRWVPGFLPPSGSAVGPGLGVTWRIPVG